MGWAFWRRDPDSAIRQAQRDESKTYKNLGHLISYMKEDSGGGLKAPGYVGRILDDVLQEISHEESALRLSNADSFVFRDKIKLSEKWGADKTWGEALRMLMEVIQAIFKGKRRWIEDLRGKWQVSNQQMPVEMKVRITLAYAETLQEAAHGLFTVLETLRTREYRRYEDFYREIYLELLKISRLMEERRRESLDNGLRKAG